jgi:aminopeptidase
LKYEDFVFTAVHAEEDDPVAYWQQSGTEQQKAIEFLTNKQQVVLRGPNVDLTLSINGRTFINSVGHFNMPDGEIFTGPVEDSVNGWVKFTYPAIAARGRGRRGITFNKGRVDREAEKEPGLPEDAELDQARGTWGVRDRDQQGHHTIHVEYPVR